MKMHLIVAMLLATAAYSPISFAMEASVPTQGSTSSQSLIGAPELIGQKVRLRTLTSEDLNKESSKTQQLYRRCLIHTKSLLFPDIDEAHLKYNDQAYNIFLNIAEHHKAAHQKGAMLCYAVIPKMAKVTPLETFNIAFGSNVSDTPEPRKNTTQEVDGMIFASSQGAILSFGYNPLDEDSQEARLLVAKEYFRLFPQAPACYQIVCNEGTEIPLIISVLRENVNPGELLESLIPEPMREELYALGTTLLANEKQQNIH